LIKAALHTEEQQLLYRLTEGDQEAFDHLYHRYSKPLYYNLLKLIKSESEAEELVQEIFCRVWHKKESLDIQGGFGNYLFGISRNLVHDFYRKAKRNKQLRATILAIATEQYSHIEENLLRKEDNRLLKAAIDALPPARRQVFRLCKLEGKSYEETSSLLEISVSTVNDHIVKGTRSIREFLYTHQDMATTVLLCAAFKDIL
jgi:RNA polymerase sigma-70 factor (family 1)